MCLTSSIKNISLCPVLYFIEVYINCIIFFVRFKTLIPNLIARYFIVWILFSINCRISTVHITRIPLPAGHTIIKLFLKNWKLCFKFHNVLNLNFLLNEHFIFSLYWTVNFFFSKLCSKGDPSAWKSWIHHCFHEIRILTLLA